VFLVPIGRAHNVVIDWDNEYAIAVGAQPRNQSCAAGLEYINLDDPSNPYKPGCASSDGYTHDAQYYILFPSCRVIPCSPWFLSSRQKLALEPTHGSLLTRRYRCVTYNGPDRRYNGRNICVAYNEDS